MHAKAVCFLLTLAVLFAGLTPVSLAEEIPEQLIHETIIAYANQYPRPEYEFSAEGHHVLGTETNGYEMKIYLTVSSGCFGFIGGRFACQSGTFGAPYTIVAQKIGSEWRLKALLEIEDYNEIPFIFPERYEKLFFSTACGEEINRQMIEQARAYLDELGRTEPIGEENFESSPLPVVASNLLISAFDSEPWPDYSFGTRETLENGERFLYTRTWQAEEGAKDLYLTENDIALGRDSKGPGTLTMVKARKDAGEELERITVTVRANRELTVFFKDAYGSLLYEFPYNPDGPYGSGAYLRPTVTAEGSCAIDTVKLDRAIDELDGETRSTITLEAECSVSDSERFALLKDRSLHTLQFQRLQDGAWTTVWERDDLIPATSLPVILYGDATHLTILAGEESPSVYISLSRKPGGEWQVDFYQSYSSTDFSIAEIHDDYLVVYRYPPEATGTWRGLVFQCIDRSAAALSPSLLYKLYIQISSERSEVHLPDALPDLTDDFETLAGGEMLYLSPEIETSVPVYSAPSASALRAANGKAAVSLNGPFGVLGCADGWLFVLYETSSGKFRTGWVEAAGIEPLEIALAEATLLSFAGNPLTLSGETALFDDPVNRAGALCTLPAGTAVSVLAESGYRMPYVETEKDGARCRGFIEIE